MPFTFAHPIIILPFKKYFPNYFSLTALVIGSLMPDFEYFMRMQLRSAYSHSLLGLFTFNLPVGLAFCFIFHNIIRNDLFANLPLLRSRLTIYNTFNFNNYFIKTPVIVVTSLLIGATSHILWDNFTHISGFFVERISFLQSFISIVGITLPVYKILQYSGGLMGMLILFLLILKLPKFKIVSKINAIYWLGIILIILAVFIIKTLAGLNYRQYGNVIVVFISAGIIAIILVPLIKRIFITIKAILRRN
ncbi:MAG: DUF4184 family protein [Spirochaetaceae bacterium]|nr:DUF4184 family protein [Spirochaetaceae bacterium]